MIRDFPIAGKQPVARLGQSACDHRAVSKAGRIICTKIVEGDNAVGPEICHACPVKAINCQHLCFSLRQTSPSPLTIRFNGRTEVWDDDPPEVRLQEAACAAKVVPVRHARTCLGCALRMLVDAPAPQTAAQQCPAASNGKIVAFPVRSRIAAAG